MDRRQTQPPMFLIISVPVTLDYLGTLTIRGELLRLQMREV